MGDLVFEVGQCSFTTAKKRPFYCFLTQNYFFPVKIANHYNKQLTPSENWDRDVFLSICPREFCRKSLTPLGNSLGQISPDNPYGLSTVCTTLSKIYTNPKLDTRNSVLVLPTRKSETGWTGELWSKTNLLNWQN